MKSMILISYDNGQLYEDHRTTPVCVVPTKKRADKLIARCIKWVRKTKEGVPPVPEASMPDDNEYFKAISAREEHIHKLKPPYGFPELIDMVWDDQDLGSLILEDISVLK